MWVKQFSTMMHQQVDNEEIDDPPDPPVQEIQEILPWYPLAEATGLTGLRDFYWNGVDHAFTEALVERWSPLTNSFHFYWGDMTITLHDVVCLLGLPIEGRACVAPRQLSRVEVVERFDLAVADVTTTATNQKKVHAQIAPWLKVEGGGGLGLGGVWRRSRGDRSSPAAWLRCYSRPLASSTRPGHPSVMIC